MKQNRESNNPNSRKQEVIIDDKLSQNLSQLRACIDPIVITACTTMIYDTVNTPPSEAKLPQIIIFSNLHHGHTMESK
jgi:hypothetical protein